jgi:hypothetical protein
MTAGLLLAALLPAQAQDPTHRWLSLRTTHFHIHFAAELEPLARRIAANAEYAYGQLAKELTPPRGPIDIVLSDDVDAANGGAVLTPTNRIYINATPPVGEPALRYTTDWMQLVVTHELAHIFHLDRSRGVWSLAQKVFGRNAALFPNLYSPSWLAEGLAVYYESRLAGQGRIEGAEHAMIARAAAADRHFPRLGDIGLAAPDYPYGSSSYIYGSLFIDHLARTRGPAQLRSFVESQALFVPFLLDVPARLAFGSTLGRAYRAWSDSLAGASPPGVVATTWKDLTLDGGSVAFPRWRSDSTIVYSGTSGRETYGAYEVRLDGSRTRLGRRNSRSPNITLADGSLLFAQTEFTSPYAQRSDLFIERDGVQQRLTTNARLTTPDARRDGEIVAIQLTPGATRVVRVSPDGRRVTPITSGNSDEQWTEPRWSPRGDRIAVVRWLRGGTSQIVIIDTLGTIRHVSVSGHIAAATPTWRTDNLLMFSVAQEGRIELWGDTFVDTGLTNSAAGPRFARSVALRATSPSRAVFDPDAQRETIAAVQIRGDGQHLGVLSCCGPDLARVAGAGATLRTIDTTGPDPRTAPRASDASTARRYSPWRTLIPRHWSPALEAGFRAGEYRFGGTTFGRDVIGRHAVAATLLVPTDNSGLVGGVAYTYRGLGLPVLDGGVSQDWSWYRDITDRDAARTKLGEVHRRVRDAAATATWVRPRMRTSFTLSASVGAEQRSYFSRPAGLFPLVDTTGRYGEAVLPRVVIGGGFANYQTPTYAISPEDGISVSVSIRERLRSGFSGDGGPSTSAVGVFSGYKALDLTGFSHHVLALRTAVGWADDRAAGSFEVGGTSGSSFEIIPGYAVGEGRRTFGVRGFASGTLSGTRAYTVSGEYRVPLIGGRASAGVLPLFVQRSSVSLWGDMGSAWCPTASAGREACVDPFFTTHRAIGSVGAELNVIAGLLTWDVPYRFRAGVAIPTYTHAVGFRPSRSFYLTSGLSF